MKRYKDHGIAGIRAKKRGREKGERRVLSPEQEKEIRGISVDKHPERLKWKGRVWMRKNIAEPVERLYGMFPF